MCRSIWIYPPTPESLCYSTPGLVSLLRDCLAMPARNQWVLKNFTRMGRSLFMSWSSGRGSPVVVFVRLCSLECVVDYETLRCWQNVQKACVLIFLSYCVSCCVFNALFTCRSTPTTCWRQLVSDQKTHVVIALKKLTKLRQVKCVQIMNVDPSPSVHFQHTTTM